MKLSSVAVALLVSVVVYLTGNLLFSPVNQVAYETLQAHLNRLEDNVAELKRHHAELASRVDLYRRSADAVGVQARSLEYYEPGQEVIRVEGEPQRSISESPGTILRKPAPGPDYSPYIRLAALLAFLVALFVQLVAGDRSVRSGRHPRVGPARPDSIR